MSRRARGPARTTALRSRPRAINSALLATAEKRRLEMDPASGAELESLAKEVMAATPDVVQRMEKLLSGK